ncbi:MAG: DUF4381 domain-containing protein [Thermodesulfobacteriota bacterium]
MNPPDPLTQLRDIHLPEPVSWWPPAPGWWLMALVAVVLLVVGGRALLKYIRRNRYRRVALAELRRLRGKKTKYTAQELLERLASLLRRVAIQSCGRQQVASLVGERWLRFLDETGSTDQFTGGAGRMLGEDHYHHEVKKISAELFQLAEKWIRGHKKC